MGVSKLRSDRRRQRLGRVGWLLVIITDGLAAAADGKVGKVSENDDNNNNYNKFSLRYMSATVDIDVWYGAAALTNFGKIIIK